jgi:hypothetical protein
MITRAGPRVWGELGVGAGDGAADGDADTGTGVRAVATALELAMLSEPSPGANGLPPVQNPAAADAATISPAIDLTESARPPAPRARVFRGIRLSLSCGGHSGQRDRDGAV